MSEPFHPEPSGTGMPDTGTSDPFAAIRIDDGPLAPRPDFAASLRARLLTQIQGDNDMSTTELSATSPAAQSAATQSGATQPGATQPGATQPGAAPPPQITGVTPYLIVRGGIAALDFYRDAFGAVEEQRFLGDDGRIGHAEIRFGPSKVMLADEYPEHGIVGPATLGGTACTFHLDLTDVAAVDATWAHAVDLGATSGGEPADQFHGNRSATVIDPFGHRWILTAPIATLSTDEYVAAGAKEGYAVTVAASAPAETVDDVQIKHYDTGDLYYFTIPVRDLPTAQAFFGAVLGWQFGDPAAGHVSNIAAPPGAVHEGADSTHAQLWFVVDDIHAAVATVRELGGSADEPVLYESGWSADCTDDQGTPFSLSVPADKYRR